MAGRLVDIFFVLVAVFYLFLIVMAFKGAWDNREKRPVCCREAVASGCVEVDAEGADDTKPASAID